MKKKLQKKKDDSLYRGAYITYMDYFATGEGRTLEINFCYANSSKEAIGRHLDRFCGQDADARNYFGVGVEAYLLESKKGQELLKRVFRKHITITKILKEAGCELYWKFYYNYS